MKKYFIFMLFLCWAIPLSANAEFLEENSSFQIAKVNKIGRGEVFFNGMSAKIAGQSSRYEDGSQEHSQIAHMCNSLCADCVHTSGTCLKCSDPEHKMLDGHRSNNGCIDCPLHATCNGVSFTCNTGYYKSGNRCLPCSEITVQNGTCNACNASSGVCTEAACNTGYVANGAQCVKCGSIVNGTCTACTYSNGATTCTAANCNSGYGFIRKRSDNGVAVQWEAGCYPKGTCASYNEYPLCMFVSEATGKGQCKGDYGNGHFANTGIECTACGDGTMWVQDQKTCVNCSTIPVANGTCTSCLNGTCTAIECNGNYHLNDEGTACVKDTCIAAPDCTIMNGTCTSCSNNVCQAATCNSGYTFRTRDPGRWEAGCYPKSDDCTAGYGNNASCHFVNESTGKGQCKTDSIASGHECQACPTGSHWVYSSSNICGYGTCVPDEDYVCNWSSSDVSHTWNADGAHTVPDSAKCWVGYGHYSTITVPEGAYYQRAVIAFWGTATVNGSMEAKEIQILNGTSTTTFNGNVSAKEIMMEMGKVAEFKKGLKGKPKCTLRDSEGTNGSCSCTESRCSTDVTSCETGYYMSLEFAGDGKTCRPCSNISVSNGTCTACSSQTQASYSGTCTAASCNNGYYAEGGSCKACSTVSVANGTCTACDSSTGACTAVSCNSGYYAEEGSCAACSTVSVANGSCTACNSSTGACTAVSCNDGYYASGALCEPCTLSMIRLGRNGCSSLPQGLK